MDATRLEPVIALHRCLPSSGDLVWSPYSVASALALTAAGAGGETRTELAQAVAPSADLDELARQLAGAAELSDGELAVANSLWLGEDWPFEETFLQTVLSWPGGALHNADFAGAPEAARRAINADVEKTTNGLIQDLVAPGGIDPDAAAVLVNALYLKAAWLVPFPEERTAPASFRAPSGRREVPTMRLEGHLGYAEADGWRMVTLPAHGEVAVDVLLPDGDLGDAERELTTGHLQRLHDALGYGQVRLSLPRFRVEQPLPLTGPLEQLGVRAVFDRDLADLTGVTPRRPVWVGEVLHKAVLTVDETGLEGAAATAVLMAGMAAPMKPPVRFDVDRPFLAVVRNTRTDAVYFLARVTEP